MAERITFKGKEQTLVGRKLNTGNAAPDFILTDTDLKEVRLEAFSGKVKVITTFLSLDTPVCDFQVKEFNKRASGLSSDVAVIGVSRDLPFAQKRFCESFEIKNAKILSDYRSFFGINYGLLIKELELLARTVIIIDKNDTVRYIQMVGELTSPPDYEAAIKAVDEILKKPEAGGARPERSQCKACEAAPSPLTLEEIKDIFSAYPQWEIMENKKAAREYKFKDFSEAKYFMDALCLLAEVQGHHPVLTINYNKVKVSLTTHAAGGLTENDVVMIKAIEEMRA